MKRIKSVFVILVFAFSFSYAGFLVKSPAGSDIVEIKGILTDGTNGNSFLLINEASWIENSVNIKQTIIGYGTVGILYIPNKEMYAQILAAQANGKSIRKLEFIQDSGHVLNTKNNFTITSTIQFVIIE